MKAGDPYSRWQAGATAKDFTPVEAQALGEYLIERHSAVYRNAKHPDHTALSQEVQQLMARGSPGYLGPGGEVMQDPTGGNHG